MSVFTIIYVLHVATTNSGIVVITESTNTVSRFKQITKGALCCNTSRVVPRSCHNASVETPQHRETTALCASLRGISDLPHIHLYVYVSYMG